MKLIELFKVTLHPVPRPDLNPGVVRNHIQFKQRKGQTEAQNGLQTNNEHKAEMRFSKRKIKSKVDDWLHNIRLKKRSKHANKTVLCVPDERTAQIRGHKTHKYKMQI